MALGPGAHFRSPHALLGLVVVVLAIAQSANGALRPPKPGEKYAPLLTLPLPARRALAARRAWSWAHAALGHATTLAALAACVLGAAQLDERVASAAPVYTLAAGVLVGAWLVLALMLELRRRACEARYLAKPSAATSVSAATSGAAPVSATSIRVTLNGSATSPAEVAISPMELKRHALESDCWVVIRGRVYDTTRFLQR